MFCTRCGAETAATMTFCPNCGQSLGPVVLAPVAQPAGPATPSAAAVPAPAFLYAGFWRRFAAILIDGVVTSPVAIAAFVVMAIFVPVIARKPNPDPAVIGALIGVYIIVAMVSAAGHWLYFTLMESSRHQGTLGKIVMAIKVTDLAGQRISFARANGRFFAKWISGMTLYIGFIMAAFTERRQALHDIIASCLVVRR